MKFLTLLIFTLTLAFCGSDIAAAKTVILDKTRTINIEGSIDGKSMSLAYKQIKRMMNETRPKKIYLLIDSPGGSVVAGLRFIQLMHRAQNRGIRIHCVVNNQAMSMAFGILTQCTKRYAFGSSLLLWHKVRQMAMFALITRHKGKVWEHQIGILDDYLDDLIFKAIKVPKKYYDFASQNNIVHTGKHIEKLSPRFMVIIDDFKFRSKK